MKLRALMTGLTCAGFVVAGLLMNGCSGPAHPARIFRGRRRGFRG